MTAQRNINSSDISEIGALQSLKEKLQAVKEVDYIDEDPQR